MNLYPKLLILFILTEASCATNPVNQHPYYFTNSQKGIEIKGQIIGLEEMDHFNALEASFIEHELVDDTKAHAKIIGTIEQINESTLLLSSDSFNYFYAELEPPLLLNDSVIHRKCILQGIAQMENSSELKNWLKPYTNNKKRFLRFDARAVLVLK